ncbi:M20/M25/M40 family metallo-hydrolase [Lichenicola sp.]|uniref:M20/M25/M40 family metallo-hydrolase n=1 Tax=Lichenicola sp. TaxID=2804529 RepID=UPI003B00B5F5
MRCERWADRLVRRPSVTGTADEASFAAFLAALLRESPAFEGWPDDVWLLDVPGGQHPRACVLGLVRGSGTQTVVLTGHFDTVGTTNYGDLQPLACDPDGLLPALLQSLDALPGDAAALARDDLASGEFVPGRGLLDMKAGLAAALTAIEGFAADPARRGNLLFLAVPDEEANSAGARAAAAALPDIAAAHCLALSAAINLDAVADPDDGSDGRTVALGTVGKLCPSALVIGRPVHAGYAYSGIGAASLGGALAAEMEWSPELGERMGATLLGMKDDRTAYDVTMPGSVWLYWNVLTETRQAADLLARFERVARCTGDTLLAELRRRRAAVTGRDDALAPVTIVTYATLLQKLLQAQPDAAATIDAAAADLAQAGLDVPEQCRRLTLMVAGLAQLEGPAIVLGFASMPYLPTMLEAPHLEPAIRAAVAQVAARHDTTIGVTARFPAICDMSVLGQANRSDIPPIAANTPLWGHGLDLSIAGIPIINAGPWGRDYHTRLERMHRDYGYEVLPDLVSTLARALLDAARDVDGP